MDFSKDTSLATDATGARSSEQGRKRSSRVAPGLAPCHPKRGTRSPFSDPRGAFPRRNESGTKREAGAQMAAAAASLPRSGPASWEIAGNRGEGSAWPSGCAPHIRQRQRQQPRSLPLGSCRVSWAGHGRARRGWEGDSRPPAVTAIKVNPSRTSPSRPGAQETPWTDPPPLAAHLVRRFPACRAAKHSLISACPSTALRPESTSRPSRGGGFFHPLESMRLGVVTSDRGHLQCASSLTLP